MNFFKADDLKLAIKEVVQECLQPLKEDTEKRLKILEKVIDEKANSEEESIPMKMNSEIFPVDVFWAETHVGFLTLRYQSKSTSSVVSPFSIILGWFPFYNKADIDTRKLFREKVLMYEANQRIMEQYFFNLSSLTWSSYITVLKRENNLSSSASKPSFSISSFFSRRNQNNEIITCEFYTSPTSKRTQEFITWQPGVHYYSEADRHDLEILKIKMEGDGYLHVFLSDKYFDAKQFTNHFSSPNIYVPVDYAKPEFVKITLPVFTTSGKTNIDSILKHFELKEEAFEHDAEFQLNQSGVNVSHVPLGESSFEIMDHPENKKPIEFVANRPFLFMLTKSNHVVYMGWYQ